MLEPVDLSMGAMKHISAQWLVKMWEYIIDNPQFIVNGFVRSGICRALDGLTSDDELDDLLEEMDPASDTIITSSSSDELDYQSSEADDESIIGVCNEATPIVLYSSSSDEEPTD